jgi:hypothetical protein
MKTSAIITITEGLPDCIFAGDVGAGHEQFRTIKKAGWQGFDEAHFLTARGLEKAKFKRPLEPEKPKVRPRKTEE